MFLHSTLTLRSSLTVSSAPEPHSLFLSAADFPGPFWSVHSLRDDEKERRDKIDIKLGTIKSNIRSAWEWEVQFEDVPLNSELTRTSLSSASARARCRRRDAENPRPQTASLSMAAHRFPGDPQLT